MRAMLAVKTRKSKVNSKFYGTTKCKLKAGVKKTYINQHAAFLIAVENGACYCF
jgi:hypothetical protein